MQNDTKRTLVTVTVILAVVASALAGAFWFRATNDDAWDARDRAPEAQRWQEATTDLPARLRHARLVPEGGAQ